MNLDKKILRTIVDKNFSWKDLNPKRFSDYDVVKSNVFCCFHEHNYQEGNAKFYYDEEKDVYLLHCFVERVNFYPHDYVERIICKEWEKYRDILDFLRHNMSDGEIIRQYKLIEKNTSELDESNFEKKKEYIDNVFDEAENLEDYIERLYVG